MKEQWSPSPSPSVGPLQHRPLSGGSLASLHVTYVTSIVSHHVTCSVLTQCRVHSSLSQGTSPQPIPTAVITLAGPGKPLTVLPWTVSVSLWLALHPILHLADLDWISSTFKLCSPLTSQQVGDFQAWIEDTWFNLGMGKRLCSGCDCLLFLLLSPPPSLSKLSIPSRLSGSSPSVACHCRLTIICNIRTS